MECFQILEIYRLWASYLENGAKIRPHEGLCAGCPYFQVGPFRLCKESGLLYAGDFHICDEFKCPVTKHGIYTVCDIAGTVWQHVCDASTCPLSKAGEFMVCTITGRMFERDMDTTQHFFEWCAIKKKLEPTTQYTQVVKRIMDAMNRRAFQIIDQIGNMMNKKQVSTCIAAAFFHCKQSPSHYRCFIGCMLRIMLASSDTFGLPRLQFEGPMLDTRKWNKVVGYEHNTVTQMERSVRKLLIDFKFTDLKVPRSVCAAPERYLNI